MFCWALWDSFFLPWSSWLPKSKQMIQRIIASGQSFVSLKNGMGREKEMGAYIDDVRGNFVAFSLSP